MWIVVLSMQMHKKEADDDQALCEREVQEQGREEGEGGARTGTWNS